MSEIYQIVCPVCSRSKPIKPDSRLPPFTVEPSNYGFISIRSRGGGPGRGHKGEPGKGLHRIGMLTLVEALNHPDFSDIAEDQRQRLIQMFRSYLTSGILNLEEVT